VPKKRKHGRPKGSGKKAVAVTAAAPSSSPCHGRPPGSKNKKTLATLAAAASRSVGPNMAASLLAGSSRLQPMLPAL
jgi:hypothetical protein